MESIDILGWVDGLGNFLFIEMTGQRQLHEYAVNRLVCIEIIDQSQYIGLRYIGRQRVLYRVKSA